MPHAAATHDACPSPRDHAGGVLALGFGTTVAMWAAGYFTHLPGLRAPGWLTLGLLAACLLAGGWAAGWWRAPALGVGLLAGLLNLLVLGSLLFDAHSGEIRAFAWLWAPASVLACGAVAAIGGVAGRAWAAAGAPSPDDGGSRAGSALVDEPDWPMVFALVACGATLLLLSVGGAVTGFEAGLAVPDWPSSFGYNMFLYPLARMTGGIYFEHAHRLFGALVGLTTLVLAAYLQFVERRTLVRALAAAAVVTVIVQGVLGGTRVTHLSLALAIAHGILAQVFLGLLSALVVLLARRAGLPDRQLAENRDARLSDNRVMQREDTRGGALERGSAGAWGGVALGLAAATVLLVQLALGACLRHLGAQWALVAHLAGAVAVLGVVGTLAFRSWAHPAADGVGSRLGLAILLGLAAQLGLGLAALVATAIDPTGRPHPAQVLVTTAHQTLGAALLALVTALIVLHLRAAAFATAGTPATAGNAAIAATAGTAATGPAAVLAAAPAVPPVRHSERSEESCGVFREDPDASLRSA